MISLDDICVKKDNKLILKNISMEITERRVGIIGRNGSGKSTLAKIFNGLEKPYSGKVKLTDKENNILEPSGHVGFVFQNPDNQIVFPIVEEDLAFGLKKSGLSKEEITKYIEYYLGKFNLNHLKSRYTYQLSGGEKQLIALIGVLIMQPTYIVLDEPTTLLDLANKVILVNILNRLEQNLIIVSHDLDLIKDMDKVILIDNGAIIFSGDATTAIDKYKKLSNIKNIRY